MQAWNNFDKIYLQKIQFSHVVLAALYVCGICFFLDVIFDYNKSFVHVHFYRDILPQSLMDGLNVTWHDFINTMQVRGDESRPRFLAYGIQILDQKFRLFLYNFTFVHPTIAPIAWFFQLFVGPYYLFKSVFNLTGRYQSAAAALIVYITSIGFLSGFTIGWLQGKALSNVAIILPFYLMTVINKIIPKGTLLYETEGTYKHSLLLVIFLGLFIDEIPLATFILLPIIFSRFFFIRTNNKVDLKRFAKNWLFFCLPGIAFLTLVIFIVPILTSKYFDGYTFNYLSHSLSVSNNDFNVASIFNGIFGKVNFDNILQNFSNLFGLSLAPWQISPLFTHWVDQYHVGQVNNIHKSIIFLCFFAYLGILTKSEQKIRSTLIGLLIATTLFVLLLSVLMSRHIPLCTGYYYGSCFAVFFAILIGTYHSTTARFSSIVKYASLLVVACIILIQLDNFTPINAGWIQSHNIDHALEEFEQLHKIKVLSGPVSHAELKNIWRAWKHGTLTKYVQDNSVTPGAMYLVAELEVRDRVKAIHAR